MLTYTTIKNVPGYEQFKTNIVNMPIERLQKNVKIFDDFLSSNKKFFVAKDKSSRMNRDCIKEYRNFLADAIKTRIPQCVKENETQCKEKITRKCEKSVAKQKTNCYINGTNKTTNNSKQETKTMKKNTTTLNNTMLTANVAQLTDAVNKILVRLDALESKNVAPKQEFKKLRETAEEVKKNVNKVKKVAKVKKVKNPAIVNLQKKAMAMKETMTKAQLAAYEKMWSKKWYMVNKNIDKNKKEERSMAFAKGRIECAKNAIKMF